MLVISTPGGTCSPHMNLISRVLPQPVSPIIITGISHLQNTKIMKKMPELALMHQGNMFKLVPM
jgi:hypothetical protein